MPQWWSANWKNRLVFGAQHPTYAIRSVVRDLLAADERFLAALTGATTAEIRQFLGEPFRDGRFYDHLRSAGKEFGEASSIGADLYAKRVVMQYAVMRAVKPDCVLETGVANGVSSAYLLLAMERNRKGSLHSIDVNDGSFLPPDRQVGWIVPEWLRGRWSLHLGDASQLLPSVLAELKSLDVFIHDSLHTYEHMKFEYEKAYPFIRPGGVLISDDVLWNSAFPEFRDAVRASKADILRGIGFLQKPAA
ncbi:MAG TPA: class I SAM-dependent methyltransferase [Candidatus Acidoferrales bacterium]|jgi:predicted O-methyltransferase YrrM|nr:class I SAM-dependent methyltransferase [Candidatus Acidoferrales bacterium]